MSGLCTEQHKLIYVVTGQLFSASNSHITNHDIPNQLYSKAKIIIHTSHIKDAHHLIWLKNPCINIYIVDVFFVNF